MSKEVLTEAEKVANELVEKAAFDAQALLQRAADEAKAKFYIDISRIPLICQSIVTISKNIESIHDKLDNKFVTKDVFYPVKTIVFGAVGIMLAAVFSAIVYQVIVK